MEEVDEWLGRRLLMDKMAECCCWCTTERLLMGAEGVLGVKDLTASMQAGSSEK